MDKLFSIFSVGSVFKSDELRDLSSQLSGLSLVFHPSYEKSSVAEQ